MNTTRFPEWIEAADQVAAMNPTPGTVITLEWLDGIFQIPKPKLKFGDENFEENQKLLAAYNLRWLNAVTNWKTYLMETHHIQVEDKSQGGWRVLAPNQVADFVMKQSTNKLRKALRSAKNRLSNTDLSKLTPDELNNHVAVNRRVNFKARILSDEDRKPLQPPELPKPLPRYKF